MKLMQFIIVQIRKALRSCSKEYREFHASVEKQKKESSDRFPFSDMEICLARKEGEVWRPILFSKIIPENHEGLPFQSYEHYYSEVAPYDPEMIWHNGEIPDSWDLDRLKAAGYIDE